MGKLPWFPFYPDDWMSDPVSTCSLAAQGLWLRMLLFMHRYSDKYGYLMVGGSPVTDEVVARACGTSLTEFHALMRELKQAGVPSWTGDNVLFSRRMVRDARRREQGAARTQRWRDASRDAAGDAGSDATGDVCDAVEVQKSISPEDGFLDIYTKSHEDKKNKWVDFDAERRKRTDQALDNVFGKHAQKVSKAHGRNVHKGKPE